MAKARSKKTTKTTTSKGKGSKKAAGGDAIDDLFSAVPGKKKSSSKSKKDDAILPDDLKEICDIYVSAKVVTKAVESKGKLAEKKIKEHVIGEWCEKFVATGVRPPTCTYHGDETQFDFIQTKRIDMNPGKLKGLQMLGFDPLEEDDEGERKHVHLTGMSIDLELVRKLGGNALQDKVKAALAKALGDHAAEVLTPTVNFKDNFLDNMVNIARESLDEDKPSKEDVTDRLKGMMKVLTPRTQARNAVSTASDEECFSYVVDADFGND